MKDLESALKLEKDYKKLRLNRKLKNSFDFLGKLKKLGFIDIQDFINEKNLNYLKNIEIEEVYNNETSINKVLSSIDNEEEKLYICVPTKTEVYVGNEYFDLNYCNDNNIPYHYMRCQSSNTVTSSYDLQLSLITYDKRIFGELLNMLKKYILKEINKDFYLEKLPCSIVGVTYDNLNNIHYSYYHISFDADFESYKKINGIDAYNRIYFDGCKGINQYNTRLTREKLINDIKTWQL